MALTASVRYSMKQRNAEMLNSYPVRSGTTIYYGALVGISTVGVTDGRLVNWSDGSGALKFAGIAIPRGTRDLPETVLGNSAGTIKCEVNAGGPTLESVSIAAATSQAVLGDLVYATSENTFTLTPTSNVGAIGRVSRYVSSGVVDVQLFSVMEYLGL